MSFILLFTKHIELQASILQDWDSILQLNHINCAPSSLKKMQNDVIQWKIEVSDENRKRQTDLRNNVLTSTPPKQLKYPRTPMSSTEKD